MPCVIVSYHHRYRKENGMATYRTTAGRLQNVFKHASVSKIKNKKKRGIQEKYQDNSAVRSSISKLMSASCV